MTLLKQVFEYERVNMHNNNQEAWDNDQLVVGQVI